MVYALANPIYDTIFKFLLEDLDIARELIGEIIGQEILSLEVKPQENISYLERRAKLEEAIAHPEREISIQTFFTVYRLDFVAEIKTPDGSKKVLIELQKAKLSADIQRFRKYSGEQSSKDILPIIAIYFIGYRFDENLPSVIEVSSHYRDRLGNKIIEKTNNEFIESLTHGTFAIQLLNLKTEMRTRLEKVLSIFSQSSEKLKEHIIYYNLPMEDELQKKIIHRLVYAASNEKLKRQMDMEEEVLMELQDLERKIENQKMLIHAQEKEREEKAKVIEESKKAIEEKDRAIEEKEKTLAEKEKLIEELLKKVKQ